VNVAGVSAYRVMKVGKKLLDSGKSLHLAVSNADEFSQELSEYGLSFSGNPVVALRDQKDQKFVMTDDFRLVVISNS